MRQDIYNNLAPILSVAPAVLTDGTVNGSQADLARYEGAMVIVATGTITDGSHTAILEESNTSGTGFTTVAAGDILGSVPGALTTQENTRFKFGYKGTKRFIRVSVTTTGATDGGALAAMIILGAPRSAPV